LGLLLAPRHFPARLVLSLARLRHLCFHDRYSLRPPIESAYLNWREPMPSRLAFDGQQIF
jgi:hypothetical protein